jgi:Peptidase A4 family
VKATLIPNAPTDYSAFFEWNVKGVYSPARLIPEFPVQPGDCIRVLVCASNPNRGVIFISNETQRGWTSVGIDAVPGRPALGTSIQWAVEASHPIGAAWAPFLPSFGEVWSQDCQAGTKNYALPLSKAKPMYAINPPHVSAFGRHVKSPHYAQRLPERSSCTMGPAFAATAGCETRVVFGQLVIARAGANAPWNVGGTA